MSAHGASADADRACGPTDLSQSALSQPEALVPCVNRLNKMLAELLHPLRGIERGLLPSDDNDKLIGIKVGEVRKVARCLRVADTLLAELELRGQA